MMTETGNVVYECPNFRLDIERPAPGIVVVRLAGSDAGEFGDDPLRELDRDLADDRLIELYIDARHVQGVTVAVIHEWSAWLHRWRARFKRVTMLTGTWYIKLTAGYVRRFAGLEDIMVYHGDSAQFDKTLTMAVAHANEPPTLADGPSSRYR
jgi:hypothetical protein